jgi:radical SAM superfamily enzyme YgiQ (UPF0313 family)
MKGRVILFHPAPRDGVQTPRRVELPLGLLSIATPLANSGYDVRIIDEFADEDWKEKLDRALDERPICFGVTCMTGPQIRHALRGCEISRKRHPDAPIVWGGVHPSLMPEQTLKSGFADFVVVGEGEETFKELVTALESKATLSKVPGLAYREKSGKMRFTGERPFIDLDVAPPLRYDLVDINLYRRRIFGVDHVSMNASRGCTLGCAFCWDPAMHKRKWRAMSPETVLDRMERIARDLSIRGFLFTDDNFFLDMKRARAILEGVARANLGLTIGKLQVRADAVCRMDREFFKLLERANVKRLTLGIESGSQRVLDFIKKGITVEEAVEANRKLAPYRIVPHYLFMMGLPGETVDDFKKSIALALKLTDENQMAVKTFNIYTPYPGTELYSSAIEMGLKEPARMTDWADYYFRSIPDEAPWVDPELKRLIEGLDFPLMFLEKGKFVTPFRATNAIVTWLSRLYRPVALYRVKNAVAGFPIESKLVKALGLFGR